MLKYLLVLVFISTVTMGFSQTDTSLLYLRFPTLPPFSLTKIPDSSSFTRNNLVKKKATVIIFFNTDCDHCQVEIKKLTAKIDQLKNVQIIMVSAMGFNLLQRFYEDYKIADYPNITMARDPSYNFTSFYKAYFVPQVYMYDKNRKFLNVIRGIVPVEEIAKIITR